MIGEDFKIFDKEIISEKNYFKISGSHDGYQKKYGTIHKREVEFFYEKNKLIGKDILFKKKNFKSCNFEIRFHLLPNTKVTKTQNEFFRKIYKFYSKYIG